MKTGVRIVAYDVYTQGRPYTVDFHDVPGLFLLKGTEIVRYWDRPPKVMIC